MASQAYLSLNDGASIPQLGFGAMIEKDRTTESVRIALQTGYRHLDTARIYGNEVEVGDGIRASGIPREEIFVTTKLWNDDQGSDSAPQACKDSLKRLGLDYVDLYLIHWPCPRQDKYVQSWQALIRLKQEGLVRSIGVSNFMPDHLKRIIDESGVTPAINQIELHPRFQQRQLRDTHAKLGIATEPWGPLGYGKSIEDPTIIAIAAKHRRSPAQVIVRWHLDNGFVPIPKSSTPERIKENFEVLDFHLDAADLERIAALDSPEGRVGPNPNDAES